MTLKQQARVLAAVLAEQRAAMWHCDCGNTPCDGLDCGVYLPGQAPRKKSAPKSPVEMASIRSRAWATRRAKYGVRGHA